MKKEIIIELKKAYKDTDKALKELFFTKKEK
jgi:hypothetical protein